jgi:UDP-2,3-diacylglucosamine hydrolase
MGIAAVVIADVHARPGARAFPDFLAHLGRRPPTRLILLGDLFDYWLETDRCLRSYAAIIGGLADLRRAGWIIALVTGNREIMAGNRLARAARVTLHWPWLELTIGGRRCRCCHGDQMLDDPGYRLWSTWMRGKPMRLWSQAVPDWGQDLIARILRRTSSGREAPSRGARRRLQPALDGGRLAPIVAGVDLVLAGHLHIDQRLQMGRTEIQVLGDWSPERPRWLEIDDAGACHRHGGEVA